MEKRVGLREWGVRGHREVWEDLGAPLPRPCDTAWVRAVAWELWAAALGTVTSFSGGRVGGRLLSEWKL